MPFRHTLPDLRLCVLAFIALMAGCYDVTAPSILVYADRAVTVQAASAGWESVSVGGSHSCGIRAGGALYCWGSNASSQLGLRARGRCGSAMAECEGGPRAVAAGTRFIAISAGQRHTCALTEERALLCWGESLQFQTGVEATAIVQNPTAIRPDLQFVDVSAGATHTCAIRTNGVVYCWGEGQLGALGRGDTLTSVFPMPIASALRFTRVRSGRLRSCAIATDATLWCWGAEWESSDGAFDFFHTRTLPHRVDGIDQVTDVSVNIATTCAITLDRTALCWESNLYAQLGLGTLVSVGPPTRVATDAHFSGITTGTIQSCGTSVDGRAFCWGNNSFGQLGVPRPGEHCGPAQLECSRTPLPVFGMQTFASVATGFGNHVCGITTNTAILCWGLGSDGQLGDGYARDRQSLPVGVLAPAP